MERLCARPVAAFRISILAALILGISASAATAQGAGPLTASARRLDEFNKQTDKALKDDKDRQMDGKKLAASELRKTAALRAEIEEDLNGLQSGYNEFVIKLQAREAVSEQFVTTTAGKIYKHATRLKSNIRFPEPADGKQSETTGGQNTATLRRRIVELCNDVLSFFDSPFFENPNILDIPKAIEARKLLENIISNSSDLQKRPI